MDFSSLNPDTSNALNLAARHNDVDAVTRLLSKMNPNCIDNRGWTCLHEAAANDSLESMMLILQHPDCRPLAESHEGHTALYVACRFKRSLQTIQALLDSVPDIANYGCTEQVTPLHIASGLGRIDYMELLIKYGAMLNVQDFDGDTPLHDAAGCMQPEAINVLLHAGADPEIINAASYTPLHLPCYKGCLESVVNLIPFSPDINMVSSKGDTALMLATMNSNVQIVKYLLENGADPNIQNWNGHIALTYAITLGNVELVKLLIEVSDLNKLNKEIIQLSCKANYFNYDVVILLLTHLGPEFYEYEEPFPKLPLICNYQLSYTLQAPLNTFLNVCEYVYKRSPDKFKDMFYLFLSKGLSVNAALEEECPPLVFIQIQSHGFCFRDVFRTLVLHGCNVDYCSSSWKERDDCLPDAFLISMISDTSTIPVMLPYSLQCEPELILKFADQNKLVSTIKPLVIQTLLAMIGLSNVMTPVKSLPNTVFPLKHLSRLKIRQVLRKRRGNERSTRQFFKSLDKIKLPWIIKNYLCYNYRL